MMGFSNKASPQNPMNTAKYSSPFHGDGCCWVIARKGKSKLLRLFHDNSTYFGSPLMPLVWVIRREEAASLVRAFLSIFLYLKWVWIIQYFNLIKLYKLCNYVILLNSKAKPFWLGMESEPKFETSESVCRHNWFLFYATFLDCPSDPLNSGSKHGRRKELWRNWPAGPEAALHSQEYKLDQ